MPNLRNIYNACDPFFALPPNDTRYVDVSQVRGSTDLRRRMTRTFVFADHPTCQFLCSHRGAGKTSELYRLQTELEDKGYFVVYCDTLDFLDLADVDSNLLLLGLVQRIWEEVKTRKNIQLQPGRIRTFLGGLADILTATVEPADIEVDAVLAKITFDIKRNPDNRRKVREHLSPRATTLMQAINEVIDAATDRLSQAGNKGLVVIVDNLDRIVRTQVDPLRTNHDVLFIDGSDYLGGLKCHVVYTIPPALLYSPNGNRLGPLYGGSVYNLPMLPVTNRDGSPNENGMTKLREIVKKRLEYATEDMSVFDQPKTLDAVCEASGGYVRALLTLARTSIIQTETETITQSAVEAAIHNTRDNALLSIAQSQYWQALAKISRTKKIESTPVYMALLEGQVVLEYRDDDGPWFDVSPIVQQTQDFKQALQQLTP